MRSSQKSNRARGRGGRKPNGSNVNRVYESAGPEGKVRGTPQQIIDKYLSLARDAQTSGDRVVAENFLQHAEHYQRILIEAVGAREERREMMSQDGGQPDFDQRDDVDADEDEGIAHGFSPRPQPEPRREQPQSQPQSQPQPQPQPRSQSTEVSGLTTIDAGGDMGGSLLVETEDVSDSQPRRRRRGPPQESESDPAPAVDAEAQPE
jgi:hypothetical protein